MLDQDSSQSGIHLEKPDVKKGRAERLDLGGISGFVPWNLEAAQRERHKTKSKLLANFKMKWRFPAWTALSVISLVKNNAVMYFLN